MTERLRRLYEEYGQSPWLDNLSRSDLRSGRLASLVASGVRGLTSNPTIFQKAIEGSHDYDEQLGQELKISQDPMAALWSLIVADIVEALDVLTEVYKASQGADGFVSVEVDPALAHDTIGTLQAARQLDDRIARPNVMIKVPATAEGVPVVRELIAEGRNVNVTLIFSLDRYADVIEAHISGLEQRLAVGQPLDSIHSVASFFVSRVDTEVDARLAAIGGDAADLRGTAAVAQARLAYQLATLSYSGPRWERLAEAGARPQRPLWASTSTKNPDYPDTMYVDSLIGPGTVNTLPEPTLLAFADHGNLARTIDTDLTAAQAQWDRLAAVGIDMRAVSEKLEREGVAAFVQSFESLTRSVTQKAKLLSDDAKTAKCDQRPDES